MAGSISLSLSQQFDSDGRPLSGGLLYFYAAGTSTPQSAYQDSGLTIAHANPITLDASGRVPSFFLADGNIKIRLTDSTGVTILAVDNLLVVGASSGSGGSVAVDATTVLATGDIKARFGTGTLSGFVRCNGNTIGPSTSGATERANADCQTLFQYLWNAVSDTFLAVSTGRGASAAADWAANKTIVLPDLRGRVPVGMNDMGASDTGRLVIGQGGANLGAAGGVLSNQALSAANLPGHTHTFSASTTSGTNSVDHTHAVSMSSTGTTSTDGAHTHTTTALVSASSGTAGGGNLLGTSSSITSSSSGSHSHTVSVSGSATSGGASATHTHAVSISGTSDSTGSGSSFSILNPLLVVSFYIKL